MKNALVFYWDDNNRFKPMTTVTTLATRGAALYIGGRRSVIRRARMVSLFNYFHFSVQFPGVCRASSVALRRELPGRDDQPGHAHERHLHGRAWPMHRQAEGEERLHARDDEFGG